MGLTIPRTVPDPLMETLFPGVPSAVEWGLDRMDAALAELGNPHLRYRTLHVGGTNGKGSVASTWASVLRQQGDRTGLYTSPHLCSFRERIMIDGTPVSAGLVTATAQRLRPLARRQRMSLFEACTLLALEIFAEEEVDSACIEVGLGGRLDATNVIRPQVTAITNVALDHQEYLGDSLEQIATEKAGIIKPGIPVVTAEIRPAALAVLEARAEGTSVRRFTGSSAGATSPDSTWGGAGTRFRLGTGRGAGLELETPLPGAHQAINAALAVRALEFLPRPPSREAVRDGVAAVRWPGRGQIRRLAGRHFIFDVAHNRAAVAALARVLADLAPPRPLVVLAGILGDKDWSQDAASPGGSRRPASSSPYRPRRRRRGTGTRASPRRRWAVGSPSTSKRMWSRRWRSASALAGSGTVVVTGSCHTVGDALLVLGQTPFGGGEPGP